jgi:preprotein translocase subunit SecF
MDILKILFYICKAFIAGVVCYVTYGLIVVGLWLVELGGIEHISLSIMIGVCIGFMTMILLEVLKIKYNRDNFNN